MSKGIGFFCYLLVDICKNLSQLEDIFKIVHGLCRGGFAHIPTEGKSLNSQVGLCPEGHLMSNCKNHCADHNMCQVLKFLQNDFVLSLFHIDDQNHLSQSLSLVLFFVAWFCQMTVVSGGRPDTIGVHYKILKLTLTHTHTCEPAALTAASPCNH